jgi:hypothetical protein
MKQSIIVLAFLFLNTLLIAQSVSINTDGSVANSSAILDIKSTDKGLLIPRMNKTEKNAIALPAAGLLIYQNAPDSIGFHYYDGSNWLWLEALANAGWKTKGNAGTDTAVNFIGTTDNMPLRFKVNNIKTGIIDPNHGNVFLGAGTGSKIPSFNNGYAMGNVLIGDSAGVNISTAVNQLIQNTYIGSGSGKTIGGANNSNTFVGANTGNRLITGGGNVIIGINSGGVAGVNTLVNGLLLGSETNAGVNALQNAAAIGTNAQIDTSNAMVLGSINGINGATANTNVGIGITKPKYPLHISRGNAGNANSSASRIATFEDDAAAYIQLLNPNANESGILAGNAETLIKSGIIFTADSTIQLRTGGNNTRVIIDDNGSVGINTLPFIPLSKLDVNGSFGNAIRIVTATTTLDVNDHTIILNSPVVASIMVNLPLTNTVMKREYTLVNQNNFNHVTNFQYRDFTNTAVSTIPANASITLQATPGAWYRVR